jgi:seryl-tRNA synthetase
VVCGGVGVNARAVSAAAHVIHAAMKTHQTAAGIAAAVDSAGMLMSPEKAAEVERLRELLHDVQGIARRRTAEAEGRRKYGARLAARVTELETERHSTNEALDEAVQALRTKDTQVSELEQQLRTVRDDRDMEIVRWLGKKAREYRSTGARQHALQADAVELMASKITRGAVRPMQNVPTGDAL